ncbi:MAG: SGNH/GDSL hydrolase family protein [Ginsengibacter sp.]
MELNHNRFKKILSFLIFAGSFLLIISCTKEKERYRSPSNNLTSDSTINSNTLDTSMKSYLALGDSYTVGQSVQKDESFPAQLVQMLRSRNLNVTDPEIVAVTGWTTQDLLNSLLTNPPKLQPYSFVTLLIGVNNQYQGRSLDEYKTQFTQLLNLAISYAGNKKNHVFVLSIPDYSVTPFAMGSYTQITAMQIDQFNEANKTISSLFEGVHYLDITPISRIAKNDPSLIAGDGLHPSGKQYSQWDVLLTSLIINEFH